MHSLFKCIIDNKWRAEWRKQEQCPNPPALLGQRRVEDDQDQPLADHVLLSPFMNYLDTIYSHIAEAMSASWSFYELLSWWHICLLKTGNRRFSHPPQAHRTDRYAESLRHFIVFTEVPQLGYMIQTNLICNTDNKLPLLYLYMNPVLF